MILAIQMENKGSVKFGNSSKAVKEILPLRRKASECVDDSGWGWGQVLCLASREISLRRDGKNGHGSEEYSGITLLDHKEQTGSTDPTFISGVFLWRLWEKERKGRTI
jgi:hypothetical protein